MSKLLIDKPGTVAQDGFRRGPCLDENCGHVECMAKRDLVGKICCVCNEKIGYGVWFERTWSGDGRWNGIEEKYVDFQEIFRHERCGEPTGGAK